MDSIASQELPWFALFQSAFTTTATFVRARLLGVAAIRITGRRTVANLLRTVASLTPGDPSRYHRVLCMAQWSTLTRASILAQMGHLGRPGLLSLRRSPVGLARARCSVSFPRGQP